MNILNTDESLQNSSSILMHNVRSKPSKKLQNSKKSATRTGVLGESQSNPVVDHLQQNPQVMNNSGLLRQSKHMRLESNIMVEQVDEQSIDKHFHHNCMDSGTEGNNFNYSVSSIQYDPSTTRPLFEETDDKSELPQYPCNMQDQVVLDCEPSEAKEEETEHVQ